MFGEDHGFLVAWFLWLTYIAILWANATALILIVRFTLGDILQFGFHYSIAGFDVYLGEALLSITAILVCGGICLCSRKLAVITQTILAAILAIGVFFFFFFALAQHKGGLAAMDPDIPPFDLVLTDMWMPEMDGAALVQAVRKHPELAPLPFYVITADIETTKDYSELGFTGILLKPVTLESLQETLKGAGFS